MSGDHGIAATLRTVDVVYGGSPPLDDPAELFHEAAKLYPSVGRRGPAGGHLLETQDAVRAAVTRAVKRHAHLPAVALPEPALPAAPFADVVARRASERAFGSTPLALEALGALLHASYGVTRPGDVPLRATPSGGALYPLELYVVAREVDGLPAGLYHYDPLRRVLERLREGASGFADALVFRELLDGCAVVVVVTAMFWRTRFKYGLRGVRFALIEVGHLAQNLLLTATALELRAVPVGGFYDRHLDDFLGVDGVDESALYTVFVGGAAA